MTDTHFGKGYIQSTRILMFLWTKQILTSYCNILRTLKYTMNLLLYLACSIKLIEKTFGNQFTKVKHIMRKKYYKSFLLKLIISYKSGLSMKLKIK